ncbi:hypothetical protein F3Y22_tig00111272pilonHSYRG00012 [Hibiscus syriacus]|uniref:Myb/SANT-like DNA-binding domain-containing protein n=1 Tax=Hibiscus syriacus TaxID=106335 RepID=A0A6A2YSA5_HIBSY|nr:hypothetical protein F3Y22_tig00111272pilonHSYRG00012 [Hibiscus syriacus]
MGRGSRKLAELGYHRSAKKCKEKFENVFKYHKRTKDGRTGKSDGKTYRFSDQLLALETHLPAQPPVTAAAAPPLLKVPVLSQATMAAANNLRVRLIMSLLHQHNSITQLAQNIVSTNINLLFLLFQTWPQI